MVVRAVEGSTIAGRSLVEWTRQKVGATKKAAFVLITNEPLEKPEFADSFVYGMEGPEALIEAVSNAAKMSQVAEA